MSSPSGTPSSGPTEAMVAAVVRLREALGEVVLPFASPERSVDQDRVRSMIDQIEDYILPRLLEANAPLLAVVGGSTGAGKSTLVNSLIGRRVTESGLLRPTTRSPVLVHHPSDAAWFENPLLLPDLQRSHTASGQPGVLQLVASDALPPGLALLDAPDIDSVDAHNRELASQLLAAADMWLFVTSAARYADQIPWQYLHEAVERSMSVAVVLDRTPPQAISEVRAHLARMLTSRGLRDAPLFAVPETPILDDGLLPASTVSDLRTWLRDFATNAVLRQEIVDETLKGAIRQLARSSHAVADEAVAQVDRSDSLAGSLATSYEEAASTSLQRLKQGEIIRGEVLARWADLVAAGDLLKGLESRFSRLRDRLRGRSASAGDDHADAALEAIGEGMRRLLVDEAELTALRVGDIVAAAIVVDAAGTAQLARVSTDFVDAAGTAVGTWLDGLADLVAEAVRHGRTPGRLSESDVPGLCVAVAILVGTSSVDAARSEVDDEVAEAREEAHRLAASVLGEELLAELVQVSDDQLAAVVVDSFGVEQQRALDAVARLGASVEAAEQLRACARRIDDLRFAAQLPAGWGAESEMGGEL